MRFTYQPSRLACRVAAKWLGPDPRLASRECGVLTPLICYCRLLFSLPPSAYVTSGMWQCFGVWHPSTWATGQLGGVSTISPWFWARVCSLVC